MTPAPASTPLTYAQAVEIADEQIAWCQARGDMPADVYRALWRPLPGVVGWGTVQHQMSRWLRRDAERPRLAA